MVAPYDAEGMKLLRLSVAPWMVGCFLDLFTQGVLMCQFNNYFSWYKEDPRWMRLVVAGLVIITSLKCLDSCALTWIAVIEYFGDLDGAVNLNYVTWWQSGVPLMGATVNIYVQTYFIYRLAIISKRHWIIFLVAVLAIFGWLSCVVATVYIKLDDADNIQHWFAAHLGSAFSADFLMTVSTAFFLLKSRNTTIQQTRTLIDMLVRLTWQSAAPSAVCATLNLILSQALPEKYIVSTIPNMLLPKVYGIAMMFTINARKNIRLVSSNSGKTSSSDNNGTTPRRTARPQDVELSRLGTIQIHKQTETVQRVDWETHTHDSGDVKYNRGESTIPEHPVEDV